MTDERIRQIQGRVEKATAGPWPETCPRLVHFREWLRRTGAERANEDVAFIAHARQDVPDLLVEVEHLRTGYEANQEKALEVVREMDGAQHPEAQAVVDAARKWAKRFGTACFVINLKADEAELLEAVERLERGGL